MRRLWRALGIALAVAAAAVALLIWAADTGTGHRLIADRIAALSPSSGLKIRIGRIEGSIYGQARLTDLRISDGSGVFLEIPAARLDWRPVSWLTNRLEIRDLDVPLATLDRLPALRPSTRKTSLLPSFDIRIGRLAVQRLTLRKAVTGVQQRARVSVKADITDGRALVRLTAATSGGDRLLVALDAAPDRDRFDVATLVDARANGALGAVLGTRKPFVLRIDGDGRWRQWQGSLAAQFAGRDLARLGLSATHGRFDLDGVVHFALMTKGKLARLSAPAMRVRGNARLEHRRLDSHVAIASPAIAISVNGIVDLARNAFDGLKIDARLRQPSALFPNMTGRDVRLAVALDGSFGGARFDYLLTSPHFAFDRTGFDLVRASGRGRLSKAPVIVPLVLTARRVTGVGDVAGGILADLRVEGPLRVTPKLITGDGLYLRSDKLTSRVTLLIDLATGRYDIGLAGQLGRYLIPGFGIVDVKSELKVVPGPGGHGTRILGRGQAWVRRFDNVFLSGLSGGLPYLETALERTSDGIIHLHDLRLRAPGLQLSGNGIRRRDGSFVFEGQGVQRRYGPVRLALDGRIERPRLDLTLAHPLDALGLSQVRLLLDPNPGGYAWRAAGGTAIGRFTGDGAILLPRGAPAVVQVARLDASGMRARGALRALPGGFEGKIALSGSGVDGLLAFRPDGGVQRIDADLAAADARLSAPVGATIRRGRVIAAVRFDTAGISLDGKANLTGLRYGGVSLARLEGSARLRGGVGQVKATLRGARGRPFDLTTIVDLTPGRIMVNAGGSVDNRPLTLVQPARLTREGATWVLAPTAVTFAGGRANVGGRFGAGSTAIDATIADLPLTVLDIAFPDAGVSGLASGRITYRRSGNTAPAGSADLRLRGLSRSGLVASSTPVDAGLAAALNDRGLAVRAVAASGGKTIGRMQLRAAPLAGEATLIERIRHAPLFAQLRYAGAVDTLWRLTGVEGIDLTGPVAIGADVTGTMDNPQIRGSVKTEALRIESAVSGTVLNNIRASGRFGGSRLVVNSFTAAAGKGTIAGSAAFGFSGSGVALDITGQAQSADIIRRDDIAATVTGPLSIKSNGNGGTIVGDVTLNRSAYRLGKARASASVSRLAVTETNRPADEAEPPAPRAPWSLDLRARAPNRMAVTGLGLDSEWRADLAIRGTLDAPAITGRADLSRGGYEFAGRRFDLLRGSIRFQGAAPPDPILDIVANANIQSVNATIKVGGTGQKPEITFSSIPALPQDELLSRLLFGTSITNLSAPEALQLASAVASLQSGGGLDPINALRKAVGLDRLRFVSADPTTGTKTAIAAGKYLTRRTYVEVISDGQGYSATRVEFEVTRWLSILSTISTIGRQSAALRVSKDY